MAATAEKRRDASHSDLTDGEVDDFRAALHTWVQQERTHRSFYLAEIGPEPIGMGSMLFYRRMPTPGSDPTGWCYVGNLYVVPAHRGVGTGERLLATMLADARALGAARVVLSPSARSVTLYRRHGFGPADGLLVKPMR